MRLKQRVESPDAVEAAGEGHVDDRQVRLGEQLLGQEQARVCASSIGETPNSCRTARRSLAAAELQVARQLLQAPPVIQGSGLDPRSGRDRATRLTAVDRCKPRCQLGAAAQAWSKSIALGHGRVWRRTGSGRGPASGPCRSAGNRCSSSSPRRRRAHRTARRARPGPDSRSRRRFAWRVVLPKQSRRQFCPQSNRRRRTDSGHFRTSRRNRL